MSDYTSWHVGMKVVCVDDQWHDPTAFGPCPLVAGVIYTVARIQPATGLYRGGCDHICVQVAEINWERGFAAPRFRPVQKRKTDISIFTAMLHDKKEHAPA